VGTEEVKEEVKTEFIDVRVKSVGNDGKVLLAFGEVMKVSDELIQLINNSTNITDEDMADEDEHVQPPPLKVKIIPGYDTN